MLTEPIERARACGLIAEQVLGWTVRLDSRGEWCVTEPDADEVRVGPARLYDKRTGEATDYAWYEWAWPAELPDFFGNLAAAWPIAERLGLALIPQSDGDGFRWLAVKPVAVAYGGAGIRSTTGGDWVSVVRLTLAQRQDGQEIAFSAATPAWAICGAALIKAGVDPAELRED